LDPETSKDSIFSAGKPKKLGRFYIPVLIAVIALVFLYKWFS